MRPFASFARSAPTAFAAVIALLASAASLSGCATDAPPSLSAQQRSALAAAIASPTRTPANLARDRYRHPLQTLTFFGVRPSDTVVEIWPGGGWYTEILAPYLRSGGGSLWAAAPTGNQEVRMREMLASRPVFAGVRPATFPHAPHGLRVPDGSADVVLTFRNGHNWMMGETPFADEAFRQMFAMLRPGGTLGVVEHRLPEQMDSARERTTGYIKVSTVRRLAEGAGFRFAGSSEVNANPLDTHDHPRGVWTLPPTLRLGDQDRGRYLAIGESDRMTLRFVKPR